MRPAPMTSSNDFVSFKFNYFSASSLEVQFSAWHYFKGQAYITTRVAVKNRNNTALFQGPTHQSWHWMWGHSGTSIACISTSGYLMPPKKMLLFKEASLSFLIDKSQKQCLRVVNKERCRWQPLCIGNSKYLLFQPALAPKKWNILPHLKCAETVNHTVWGRMSRSWRRDSVQQECWRLMEVHLDLILLATSLWISGVFSLFLGKTWAKRFRRVFHLETCSCLRVTSLLARGLHGCAGALLSICRTEVQMGKWTKGSSSSERLPQAEVFNSWRNCARSICVAEPTTVKYAEP